MSLLKLLIFLISYFVLNFSLLSAQKQSGLVINETDNKPIEFVNIGILGKSIGTTSNALGKFDLNLNNQYNNDSLRFSSIGYAPYSIKVLEFKQLQYKTITLKEQFYAINEVAIRPHLYKPQTLGYTTHSKAFKVMFSQNLLGYEAGVYLKIKKTAQLKTIKLNIIECSYDTIFYRINIYKVNGKMDFQNILTKPIYFTLSKDKIKDEISIDISSENIWVTGDCLVTIEHVKGLGNGLLMLSANIIGRTYYRETSQANWISVPAGMGLNVEANVEE